MDTTKREIKVVDFITYSQQEDSWPRVASGYISTTSRERLGKHPIICMVETDSDPKETTAEAERICESFLASYQGLEGMPPQTRLVHAMRAANSELDEIQSTSGKPAARTSVTAVAAHDDGIDYIAIGDGTIVLMNHDTARKVRRTPPRAHRPPGPTHGLYGQPIDAERLDQGRINGRSTPGELVVIGTALLSKVDDVELTWVREQQGNQLETMRTIADEVSAETGDRHPGVGLVSIANR